MTKNEEHWYNNIFIIIFGVIFAFVAFTVAWDKLTTAPACCTQDIVTITGIKSASAGGFFSDSKCVYTTDHGDRVLNCVYKPGESINEGWHC